MADYTITVVIKDVAEGDVTDVAQEIWDTHAAELDASRGDFAVTIARAGDGGGWYGVDWTPDE
jgi:hypothetical protein